MGQRFARTNRVIGFAAIISFCLACACLALPAKADAGGLKGGVLLNDVAKPTITYVASPGPGAAKIIIDPVINDADGYEFVVALDKSFKKGVKKKTSSKTAVKFTTLKKGKKYFVRVRSYARINGRLFVSSWSKVKAVHTSIARSQSKFLGSWKLVKSSYAPDNRIIQNNRKYYPNIHHVMKFNKNGYVTEKGYLGGHSTAKWAAKSKVVGYFVSKDISVGSIRIVNGKLVARINGITMTYARL